MNRGLSEEGVNEHAVHPSAWFWAKVVGAFVGCVLSIALFTPWSRHAPCPTPGGCDAPWKNAMGWEFEGAFPLWIPVVAGLAGIAVGWGIIALLQRLAQRQTTLGLLMLLVCVSLLACTSSPSTDAPSPVTVDGTPVPTTTSPPVTTYAARPARCPRNPYGQERDNDVPGTAEAVVPGEPVVLVLCLGRERTVVRDVREVQHITRALNDPTRRLDPERDRLCLLSLMPPLGLFFGYENGDVLLVTLGNCRAYWNGRSEARLPRVVQGRIWGLMREE